MEKISLNQKRLLNVKELGAYTGMSPNYCAAWGKSVGVTYRIGRRVFYDRYAVDKVISESVGKNVRPTASPLKAVKKMEA